MDRLYSNGNQINLRRVFDGLARSVIGFHAAMGCRSIRANPSMELTVAPIFDTAMNP